MTTKHTITIEIEADTLHPSLVDFIAHRVYTVDGVKAVTARLEEGKTFEDHITDFNKMYGLPALESPGIPRLPVFTPSGSTSVREQLDVYLEKVYSIFFEELNEVDAIRMAVRDPDRTLLEILTELADWLGDLQVYCASEMRKFGLPINETLAIIMASNMSKLGEDGKPIYDERGKVLKGPGYWRPEPKIAAMLKERMK